MEQDADECRLCAPEHAECDQTALLEVLPQEILARLILPLGEFDKELSENGNFVEAFRKVFNNAYENGVPNEVLLDFLSNPVAEKSSSVKATINVYRPFIWIFMLEVLSLFTAYLFATQPIIRKVKDRFKLDRLQESDLLSVGVLVGLSLILGLVIGMISSIQSLLVVNMYLHGYS